MRVGTATLHRTSVALTLAALALVLLLAIIAR
jgi:hypothetical protein